MGDIEINKIELKKYSPFVEVLLICNDYYF